MPPIRKTAPRWGTLAARLGAGLVILAVAIYFGASYALERYLHGEAFRELLNQKTSAFLGVEGHYAPITTNGFSFYSDGYTGQGRPANPLQSIHADQIRAEFEPAALFQGAWKVGGVHIQRLEIGIAPPPSSSPSMATTAIPATPNFTTSATPATSGTTADLPLESTSTLPTFAATPRPASKPSWIPSRFELKQVNIEDAKLNWPGGSLLQTRLLLEPNGHDLTATGYGGTLNQTGLPALNVDHFKIRYRHPRLYLTDSLLTLGGGQALDISGQADLSPSRNADFLVKYSGIDITPYLPQDWRAGVRGKANGEAHITVTGNALQTTGTLNLTGGQLEALPILEKIAAFTRTREFRQFALQKAEASYHWQPGLLTISRLEAESEGLIRLSGSLVIQNGAAQGDFQLGLTPSCLKWLPGSRNRVFTQEHDGYAWTTLHVSGPLDHLNEDLSARLTAAAGEELLNNAKDTLQNGAKSLFDLLKSAVP